MKTEVTPPQPQTLAEALVGIEALWVENARLRVVVGRLEQQGQAVVAPANQTSTNSSRPPSSDPPHTPPPPPHSPTGRRGGQPGHPAPHRTLVAPEQVDSTIEHYPSRCPHCQTPLGPDPAQVVGDPVRHQVVEVPPVRALVTDHYLHRLRCPVCQGETRASLPPEVPLGAFGPRLQAIIALLASRYRLSRREVATLGADLLSVDLCVGSVDDLCQATSQALAAPVAALQTAAQQAAVNADETEWCQAGQRRWLWVAVSAVTTVFTVTSSRSSQVIKRLLGTAFAGILGSDRWSAYTCASAVNRVPSFSKGHRSWTDPHRCRRRGLIRPRWRRTGPSTPT